jgi:hypothetical protein
MAPTTGRNQGKSEFVRDRLGRDSAANAKAINEAWQGAGNEGTISGALISKIRTDLGLVGKRSSDDRADAADETPKRRTRAKGPKAKRAAQSAEGTLLQPNGRGAPGGPAAAAEREARAGDQGRRQVELEGDLDDLLFKIMGQGGLTEVEEALRRARRLLVRGHRG